MSIRVTRNDFVTPRCTAACPAGVDVPRYIRAVKNGLYAEAVAVLRERLPLPTVCADACFAPCEDVCAYKQFGEPIAIRALKRAAVDHGDNSCLKNRKKSDTTGKSVGIVGAGPVGLTAGYIWPASDTRSLSMTLFQSPEECSATASRNIVSRKTALTKTFL